MTLSGVMTGLAAVQARLVHAALDPGNRMALYSGNEATTSCCGEVRSKKFKRRGQTRHGNWFTARSQTSHHMASRWDCAGRALTGVATSTDVSEFSQCRKPASSRRPLSPSKTNQCPSVGRRPDGEN